MVITGCEPERSTDVTVGPAGSAWATPGPTTQNVATTAIVTAANPHPFDLMAHRLAVAEALSSLVRQDRNRIDVLRFRLVRSRAIYAQPPANGMNWPVTNVHVPSRNGIEKCASSSSWP